MTDDILGAGVLGLLALMLVALVLAARRRPPEAVITIGSARGRPGLAIHPWRGHWSTTAVAGLLLALTLIFGLYEIGRSNYYAAGFLLGGGLAMACVGWCRATGRSGDGTVTMTPDGIHQLDAGSEVFIPWDDVRGLVTTRTDFIVETSRPVVPAHHLPRLIGRPSVLTDDAVSLPRRTLPPLLLQQLTELYATNAPARDELGTDVSLHRARGMLAGVAHPPAADRPELSGTVRWVVELVLQLIAWAMLAIGGGSLYLLVTTGSAPAIGTASIAVAVVLGSAVVIWMTRKSLYKKQYRGY